MLSSNNKLPHNVPLFGIMHMMVLWWQGVAFCDANFVATLAATINASPDGKGSRLELKVKAGVLDNFDELHVLCKCHF